MSQSRLTTEASNLKNSQWVNIIIICFLLMSQSNKGLWRGMVLFMFIQRHYLVVPPSPGTSKSSSTRCSASGSYKNKEGAQQSWKESAWMQA